MSRRLSPLTQQRLEEHECTFIIANSSVVSEVLPLVVVCWKSTVQQQAIIACTASSAQQRSHFWISGHHRMPFDVSSSGCQAAEPASGMETEISPM